jgi:hypothetical protein
MRLICSLIFIISFLSTSTYAQDVICGTPQDAIHEMEYLSKSQLLIPFGNSKKPVISTINVNAVVHIDNNCITATQSTELINDLNSIFNPHKINFVKLCDDFYTTSAPKVPYAINIYVLKSLISAPFADAVGSIAFYIDDSDINSTSVPHEMGHCLNLFHTHNERGCPELVTRDENLRNCNECGDKLCDTPADPNLYQQQPYVTGPECTYNGPFTDQKGQPYNPDTHNLMSYAPDRCRDHFTAGQGQRMYNALLSLEILIATTKPPKIEGPSEICSNSIFSFKAMSSSTISWSSSNPSGLAINQNTGEAVRQNNFIGQVTLTASINNPCGNTSVLQKAVWVGSPYRPLVSGPTLVTAASSNNYYAMPWGGQPPFLEQGVSSSGYEWTFPLIATNAGWVCFGCNLATAPVLSGSLSTWVSLRTQNVCGYSEITNYEVFVQQENCPPGGCEEPFIVYPNPSSEELMISSNSADASNNVSRVSLVDSNGSTVYKSEPNKTMKKIIIPVRELKNGTYYLTVTQKGKTIKKQLLISH